jgi:hypothetical protein
MGYRVAEPRLALEFLSQTDYPFATGKPTRDVPLDMWVDIAFLAFVSGSACHTWRENDKGIA